MGLAWLPSPGVWVMPDPSNWAWRGSRPKTSGLEVMLDATCMSLAWLIDARRLSLT